MTRSRPRQTKSDQGSGNGIFQRSPSDSNVQSGLKATDWKLRTSHWYLTQRSVLWLKKWSFLLPVGQGGLPLTVTYGWDKFINVHFISMKISAYAYSLSLALSFQNPRPTSQSTLCNKSLTLKIHHSFMYINIYWMPTMCKALWWMLL